MKKILFGLMLSTSLTGTALAAPQCTYYGNTYASGSCLNYTTPDGANSHSTCGSNGWGAAQPGLGKDCGSANAAAPGGGGTVRPTLKKLNQRLNTDT